MLQKFHKLHTLYAITSLGIFLTNIDDIIEIEDFTYKNELSGEHIQAENIYSPFSITSLDSLLIVTEDDAVENEIIKIFDQRDYENISYYGRRGDGPGEISGMPSIISSYNSEYLSYFDFERKRVSNIAMEKILSGEHYTEPDDYHLFSPDKMMLQRAHLIDDYLVIAGTGMQEGKLLFHNPEKDTSLYKPFTPDYSDIDFLPHNVGIVYSSSKGVSHNNERVAVFNHRFPQFEIYDFNGRIRAKIEFDDGSEPKFSDQQTPLYSETMNYYKDVEVTEENIYALYQGEKQVTIYGDAPDVQGEPREPDHDAINSEVHVYSWDGEPQERYILDRYIRKIAVNEHKNSLIGLDPNSLEKPLVEFEIK